MKKLLIFIFVFLVFPQISDSACTCVGNTGTSDSATVSDIQDCVNGITSSFTGAVVINIPDGNGTGGTLTVNTGDVADPAPNYTNVTELTIKGVNNCSTTNSTEHLNTPVFAYPTTCGTNIANFVVSYTSKDGKKFRLSQLRATETSRVNITGDGKTWRFDNIFWDTVSATGSRLYYIAKTPYAALIEGLIDHNYATLVNSQFAFQDIPGNAEWMVDLGLGTTAAVYLENNKVVHSGGGAYFVDNNGAARWVIRYNEITNGAITGHDFVGASSGYRGGRKVEVYNNYIDVYATGNCYIFSRVGNGVFFNNNIYADMTNNCANPIALDIQRVLGDHEGECASDSGKDLLNINTGYPGGEGSCTTEDGCIDTDGTATAPKDGWPCRDQWGVSGNNPQTGGGAPFLFWNNSVTGNGTFHVSTTATNYVVSDRDYCIHETTLPATCNSISTSAYWPGGYTYTHPLTGRGPGSATLTGGTHSMTLTGGTHSLSW